MRERASGRDLRVLAFAAGTVIAAGVLVALALFAATRTSSPGRRPIGVGLASDRRAQIAEGGPIYLADPTGGPGLWLDLEGGRLVALAVDRPAGSACTVKWRATRDAYVDCQGRRLRRRNPARKPTRTSPGTSALPFRARFRASPWSSTSLCRKATSFWSWKP